MDWLRDIVGVLLGHLLARLFAPFLKAAPLLFLTVTLVMANSASAAWHRAANPETGLLGVLAPPAGFDALASAGRIGESVLSVYDLAADDAVAARGAPSGIFSRAVSQAELDAIKNTRFLRGGVSSADNPTFFTQGTFSSATKAQRRLGLTGDLRDFRVDFRITNNPSISGPTRVNALPGRPGTGGGMEFSSPDPVEIELLNVAPLRRPR